MMKKIPILTFHSIDTSGSVISVTPLRFKQFLCLLKQEGYYTISLLDLIQWLSEEKTLPAPCVVITFDDGFENLYSHAFPILEEMDCKATLFLTTGYCGKKNLWYTRFPNIPCLPMLSWEQIKEMAQSVLNVQSHSQTHPFLFKLLPEQAKNELLGSKADIEDRLGQKVDFFAYPYGYFHKGEDRLVRQFFQGACSARLNFVSSTSDRYVLPRIDMYYFSHQMTSKFFLSPLWLPYLRCRQIFRLLRQSFQ